MKTIRKFYNENKTIAILTFVGIIIILSYHLTIDIPEWTPVIGKWYKLFNDLSIGIVINFIFFLFQIYIPGIKKEKAAFTMIKINLKRICRYMEGLILVTQHYFPELKCGKLQIPEQKVYYKLVPITSVDGHGWARKFDFYVDISPIKKNIEVNLEQITSNLCFNQNDKELIEIISNLQVNNFLKDIEAAQNSRYDATSIYGNISESFSGFCAIFDKLKKFNLEYIENKLVVLNDTEKKIFFDAVSSLPTAVLNVGFQTLKCEV